MGRHIAIVEDEHVIAENYKDAFTKQGYKVSVYYDRRSALEAFEQVLPDLAVIDVRLGDDVEGGFELCRELRGRSAELPIVFLTARESEFDIISGLRLGADDYLTKNISQEQMMVRIVALFRRIEAHRSPVLKEQVIELEGLCLNRDRMTLSWKGRAIELTVTEFWIFFALIKYPGHVKNRQQLMDAASVVLDDNTITSHIKRIRKKFIAVDDQFSKIETAYGMGYRWKVTT